MGRANTKTNQRQENNTMVGLSLQMPTAPYWAVKAPPQIAAWTRGIFTGIKKNMMKLNYVIIYIDNAVKATDFLKRHLA